MRRKLGELTNILKEEYKADMITFDEFLNECYSVFALRENADPIEVYTEGYLSSVGFYGVYRISSRYLFGDNDATLLHLFVQSLDDEYVTKFHQIFEPQIIADSFDEKYSSGLRKFNKLLSGFLDQ